MQARFILEKNLGKRISLPELVDLMADFVGEHFEEFEKRIEEKAMIDVNNKNDLPDFVQLMEEIRAPGSPDDFEDYDYDDI